LTKISENFHLFKRRKFNHLSLEKKIRTDGKSQAEEEGARERLEAPYGGLDGDAAA
jgi:hypothetical protein